MSIKHTHGRALGRADACIVRCLLSEVSDSDTTRVYLGTCKRHYACGAQRYNAAPAATRPPLPRLPRIRVCARLSESLCIRADRVAAAEFEGRRRRGHVVGWWVRGVGGGGVRRVWRTHLLGLSAGGGGLHVLVVHTVLDELPAEAVRSRRARRAGEAKTACDYNAVVCCNNEGLPNGPRT